MYRLEFRFQNLPAKNVSFSCQREAHPSNFYRFQNVPASCECILHNNLLRVSCHEVEVLVQVCILMNPLQTKLFFSVLLSEINNRIQAITFNCKTSLGCNRPHNPTQAHQRHSQAQNIMVYYFLAHQSR